MSKNPRTEISESNRTDQILLAKESDQYRMEQLDDGALDKTDLIRPSN